MCVCVVGVVILVIGLDWSGKYIHSGDERERVMVVRRWSIVMLLYIVFGS